MAWIMMISVVVLAMVLRKLVQLFGPRPAGEALLARIDVHLSRGDLGRALSEMHHTRGELAYVSAGALAAGLADKAQIEAALNERLVLAKAPLQRGIPALRRAGQIAMATGLFGAVMGLRAGFGGNADATARALELAAHISASMNCTAFGLLVAMVALGSAQLFAGRVEALEAELDHTACAVQRLLTEHRQKLRWLGARAPIVEGSYRSMD